MKYTQQLDLKNGTIQCNLCERYIRKGAKTYETKHFMITTCTRCRKALKKHLK